MSYLGVRKVARPQAKSSQTCGPPPPPRPPHPDPSWTIGIEIWFVLWFILVCTIHYALFHLYSSHHSKRYRSSPIQSGIGSSENLQKNPFLDGPMLDFRGVFLVGFLKIGEQRNNQNQWFPHEKWQTHLDNKLGSHHNCGKPYSWLEIFYQHDCMISYLYPHHIPSPQKDRQVAIQDVSKEF